MITLNNIKVEYSISLLFFLASFRYASAEAVSYSVPSFVQLIQTVALAGSLIIIVYKFAANFNGFLIKNRLIFLYFLFYICVYISVIVSNGLSIDPISRLITVYVIALFFSNTLVYGSKGINQESALLSLYVGIIAFVTLNLTMYLLGIGSLMWKGRLFGITSHPNFIGLISSISSFLSIFYLLNSRYKKTLILLLVISVSVMILSGSRNALLSFIMFLTSYSFFSSKNYFAKLLLVFGGLTIVLFFFINFSVQDLDFEGRGNNREGTWSEMWSEVMDLGILGKGKSGATSNGFLFVLTSSGIVGGIFFYLSFFGLLKDKFSKSGTSYDILFKSSLVWIIISSLFEGYFLDTVSIQIFYLMFLLTYTQNKLYDSRHPTPHPILQI